MRETPPETRYTKAGDLNIAFQVFGDGPLDLVLIPGWITHIEAMWDEPSLARFLRRLASFSRVILFDKRGVGLSDPLPSPVPPHLESWMDDVSSVMDAASSDRAALFAADFGGPLAMLFAATHPARASALVLVNTLARTLRAPDYPAGFPDEIVSAYTDAVETEWGRSGLFVDITAPSVAGDPAFRAWASRYQRLTAGKGTLISMARMMAGMDVRHVLAVISVPTLVLHRAENRYYRADHGRYIAEHIYGSRYVELPGADHLFWVGDQDALLAEVQEFLTGVPPEREPQRVLATVLFTDIVGSTARAAEIGDRAWGDLIDRHDEVVDQEIGRHRGRRIRTTGDGVLATFDGPARAIGCARAITERVGSLGMEIRSGLHTGEIELRGDDVGGIAVHIAQRVMSEARPCEIVVSRTVADLVIGSGIAFEDRGERELRSVPGRWRLYAVITGI